MTTDLITRGNVRTATTTNREVTNHLESSVPGTSNIQKRGDKSCGHVELMDADFFGGGTCTSHRHIQHQY